MGTLSAGGLALAMAELAHYCERGGKVWDEVVILISIFTIGNLHFSWYWIFHLKMPKGQWLAVFGLLVDPNLLGGQGFKPHQR